MKAKRAIVIVGCFAVSLLLLWLCNSLWDSRYTFGAGDDSIIKATLGRKILSRQPKVFDEILPVDIAYDRQLVPAKDSNGIPIGDVDIADRSKLVELLSKLKEYGNYRYILCDIALSEDYKTESDSILYSLIASMANIVVPGETPNLPVILKESSAISVYKVFHHGEPFLKYHYKSAGERTIPLKMWHDITGDDICHHWWGYSTVKDRQICNNSAVLDLTDMVGYADQTIHSKEGTLNLEETVVYHLGKDILDAGCPKELFDDKIILIGDFYERDMHDTAIGQVPGIMLLYSAFRALMDKKNHIPGFLYIILLLIFWGYSLLLYFYGGWHFKDKLISYIADSISFTLPLELFNFLTFFIGGFSVNAVLIGSLFAAVSYIKKIPRRNENVK